MLRKVLIVFVLAIVLIAICAGIGAVAFFTFRSVNQVGPISLGPVQVNAFSADATEQKSFPVDGSTMLDVESPFGYINVTSGEGSEIAVTAHKTAYGTSQERARQALNDLKVVYTQEKGQLTLRIDEPDTDLINQPGSAVDFDITVPADTTVILHSNSGRIDLSGTQGKADLFTQFGEIQVTDFKGGLAAHSRSGQVSARRIQLLEGGQGDVSLQSDFGNLNLEDVVTQKVMAHTSSGVVKLTNVESEETVLIESDFGDLVFQTGNASSLQATTRSGKVTLTNLAIEGLVKAHSEFGNIDLTQVNGGSYDLDSNSGAISVDAVRGAVKVRSDFGDIQINSGDEAVLDLETKNGQVLYRGSLGSGQHHLHSDFGNVRLVIPQDSAFEFDLETNFGDITSDFETQIDGEPDENHWVGSINGGGSSTVTVSTKNGQIALEKSE